MEEAWLNSYHNYSLVQIFAKVQDFRILFLNKAYWLNDKVASYNKKPSDKCSLCGKEVETFVHLFWECPKVIVIWKKL